MFRLLSMFTLCFSACATPPDLNFDYATQAVPHHADEVHCDSAAAMAEVVNRHHVTSEETRALNDDVSKAADIMSRHPGLLADILSVARCDTTTPARESDQLTFSYAAVYAASAAPTVEAGRSLWRLGEHLRAGSLIHLTIGGVIQEEALRLVLGPALDALSPQARAAAIADLRMPPSLAAVAAAEEAIVNQLPPPFPGGFHLVADTWLNEARCRAVLPQLLDDLRALDDLPPVQRPAAWAAKHDDYAVCTQFDAPIAAVLEHDVTLIRGLEGA